MKLLVAALIAALTAACVFSVLVSTKSKQHVNLTSNFVPRLIGCTSFSSFNTPITQPPRFGRRVALITKGPSLIGSNLGPQIDAYDTVVRLNCASVPKHLCADYGSRCDIAMCNLGASIVEALNRSMAYKSNTKVLWWGNLEAIQVGHPLRSDITHIPVNESIVTKKMHGRNCGNKALMCILLDPEVEEVFVGGFDFYESSYSETTVSFKNSHTITIDNDIYESFRQEACPNYKSPDGCGLHPQSIEVPFFNVSLFDKRVKLHSKTREAFKKCTDRVNRIMQKYNRKTMDRVIASENSAKILKQEILRRQNNYRRKKFRYQNQIKKTIDVEKQANLLVPFDAEKLAGLNKAADRALGLLEENKLKQTLLSLLHVAELGGVVTISRSDPNTAVPKDADVVCSFDSESQLKLIGCSEPRNCLVAYLLNDCCCSAICTGTFDAYSALKRYLGIEKTTNLTPGVQTNNTNTRVFVM